MERIRSLVERGVSESNSLLTDGDTLVVNTGQNCREDRGRHRSASSETRRAVQYNEAIVTHGSDIREATSSAIVDSAIGDDTTGSIVTREARVMLGEEASYG